MTDHSGLIVMADGIQAAFAAGAVAELERSGVRWDAGLGAGLGAQVAALALLGDAAEAERRWVRQAEAGCPLLRPRLDALGRRLGSAGGFLVLPDVLALGGWLDPEELEEHLAPEEAGLPHRLRFAGARLWIAVEDLGAARWEWVDASAGEPIRAARALRAAASFAGGWPPVDADAAVAGAGLWGGVTAAAATLPGDLHLSRFFMVCGFPLPAVARPAAPAGLLEAVQRRDQIAAAAAAEDLVSRLGSREVVTIAPTAEMYRRWAGREGADLGVEYPLPWERNGELATALVELGRYAVRESFP